MCAGRDGRWRSRVRNNFGRHRAPRSAFASWPRYRRKSADDRSHAHKEFRAPDFEPHLTLFSTTKDRQSPKKVLRQISLRRVRLTTHGVGFSSEFTKTLFILFKSSDALRKLAAALSRATKSPAKAPSEPHVSLLYKKLPHAPKKELAAVMKLPLRTVVFDSIASVRC